MRPNTVKQVWDDFERQILDPIEASHVQRQEMRRAFYSGVQSMLALMSDISARAATEDEGVTMIGSLSRELDRFSQDVQGGRA